MKKSGIVILEENIQSLRKLSTEDLGILMMAVLDSVSGETPDQRQFSFPVELLYPIIQGSVDRMRETSERRSAAGSSGNEKRWSQTASQEASLCESHSESQNESQSESPEPNHTEPIYTEPIEKREAPSVPREKARFTPPSVDEVSEYVREKGLHVDPQRFVDFYSSKNWMVGKNKMADWRSACRGWSSRDKPPEQKSFGRDRIDYDAEVLRMAYGG